MAAQNVIMEALTVLVSAKVLTEGGAFRLLREAADDALQAEQPNWIEVDNLTPKAKGKRNGILRSATAMKCSRSLGQIAKHGAAKGYVVADRSKLAKVAAKIGITTEKFVAWGIAHDRLIRLDTLDETYKVFTAKAAIRRFDPKDTKAPKVIAKQLGISPTTVSAMRRGV